MFCPECGNKIYENQKFCHKCGYNLSSFNGFEDNDEEVKSAHILIDDEEYDNYEYEEYEDEEDDDEITDDRYDKITGAPSFYKGVFQFDKLFKKSTQNNNLILWAVLIAVCIIVIGGASIIAVLSSEKSKSATPVQVTEASSSSTGASRQAKDRIIEDAKKSNNNTTTSSSTPATPTTGNTAETQNNINTPTESTSESSDESYPAMPYPNDNDIVPINNFSTFYRNYNPDTDNNKWYATYVTVYSVTDEFIAVHDSSLEKNLGVIYFYPANKDDLKTIKDGDTILVVAYSKDKIIGILTLYSAYFQKIDKPYIQCTSKQLLDELETNAAAAKDTYQGQNIEVTGIVVNIDASGEYLSIAPDQYSFYRIQCFIKNSQQLSILKTLASGQTVTIRGLCTDVGEILGYLVDIDEIIVN